jgi:hypothetical protein
VLIDSKSPSTSGRNGTRMAMRRHSTSGLPHTETIVRSRTLSGLSELAIAKRRCLGIHLERLLERTLCGLQAFAMARE